MAKNTNDTQKITNDTQKNNTMKKITAITQSKGGTGKSMLAYLLALKNEDNKAVKFIDLDSSTNTSMRQLAFLNEGEKRLFKANVYNDSEKKIDREKFLHVLEEVSQLDFTQIYIDFGAPESEQLPNLFRLDFDADTFVELLKELNIDFEINVIIAGGSAYVSSIQYLKSLYDLLKGKIKINAYANVNTFHNTMSLLDELKTLCDTQEINMVKFGDIHSDRESGKLIINNATNGKGNEAYTGITTKMIMRTILNSL